MDLTLRRRPSQTGATLGELMDADGKFICFTLEDRVRPRGEKVPGETTIPAGRYLVKLTHSRRFKTVLPEVTGVPGFNGVRIHGGNTEKDTEGCILVGSAINGARPELLGRQAAYDCLFRILEKVKQPIWLTIEKNVKWKTP